MNEDLRRHLRRAGRCLLTSPPLYKFWNISLLLWKFWSSAIERGAFEGKRRCFIVKAPQFSSSHVFLICSGGTLSFIKPLNHLHLRAITPAVVGWCGGGDESEVVSPPPTPAASPSRYLTSVLLGSPPPLVVTPQVRRWTPPPPGLLHQVAETSRSPSQHALLCLSLLLMKSHQRCSSDHDHMVSAGDLLTSRSPG